MKIKLPTALLLLILFAQTAISAEPKPADASNKSDADFQVCKFTDVDGKILPYRLLKPADYDPSKGPYPLLIFLHGAGERGSDNSLQLTHGKPLLRKAAALHGCFVIAPQCPKQMPQCPKGTEIMWASRHWKDKNHDLIETPSLPMQMLFGLIDEMQKTYPIDPDRLYIMGLSMGGYGTWEIIQRQPNRFAAAVPICGGGDEKLAQRIAAIPIWAFHGDKDGVVKVARSRDMITAIKKAGGNPKYTEYPGVGHNAWTPTFNEPKLLDWLCAQKKK